MLDDEIGVAHQRRIGGQGRAVVPIEPELGLARHPVLPHGAGELHIPCHVHAGHHEINTSLLHAQHVRAHVAAIGDAEVRIAHLQAETLEGRLGGSADAGGLRDVVGHEGQRLRVDAVCQVGDLRPEGAEVDGGAVGCEEVGRPGPLVLQRIPE